MEVEVPDYEIQPSITVNREDSVLLIVDMQKDFAHEDGTLYNPDAEESIPVLDGLIQTARDNDVPVWYTKDTHTEEDPEFEVWGEHCVRGSKGWQIVDQLQPQETDRIFEKSRYDGFYGTQLDHQLTVNNKDTLIIAGTVANICVHYTAASAGLRYYDVVHPVEGITALNDFDYYAALRQATFLFQADLVSASGIDFE